MKKHLSLICACVLSFALLSGCGSTGNTETTADTGPDTQESKNTDGELFIEALFLKCEDDTWLFIDTATDMPFTAAIPDTLTDADGQSMTADQLLPGNRVQIYGNNIMLQSYPAQYPGTTKMIVTDQGDAADAAAYQDMIDTFFAEPDLDSSKPPMMSIDYTTDLAAVTAVLSGPYNYTWTTAGENGTSDTVTACGAHILQWSELMDVTVEASTQVQLFCSVQPETINVTRWSSDAYAPDTTGDVADDDGEAVDVTTNTNGYFTITAEPGYVYRITAAWDAGTAEYGFVTR